VVNRFEHSDTWRNYDPDDLIKKKSTYIQKFIPSEVKTIIDVGCGNGIITNELSKKWDVTGLDSSSEALQFLNCPAIKASATDIPLQDCSFDLAFSSEMLEHLTNTDLQRAVLELKRISRKYILVTVPNQEYLEASNTKCPNCLVVFNVCSHLQSFSSKRMSKLFKPEFLCIEVKKFGPSQQKWIPLLLRARQALGQWMHPGPVALCPNCSNTVFPPSKKSIVTKIINGLNYILSGKKSYWQIMLLEKR
jgi:ubiquinone/menaquinone biosynthesis C-methylase UbiE